MNIRKFIVIFLSAWLCFCLLAKQAEASFAIGDDMAGQSTSHQIEADDDDAMQDNGILACSVSFSLPVATISSSVVAESFYTSQVVTPPSPPPVL